MITVSDDAIDKEKTNSLLRKLKAGHFGKVRAGGKTFQRQAIGKPLLPGLRSKNSRIAPSRGAILAAGKLKAKRPRRANADPHLDYEVQIAIRFPLKIGRDIAGELDLR